MPVVTLKKSAVKKLFAAERTSAAKTRKKCIICKVWVKRVNNLADYTWRLQFQTSRVLAFILGIFTVLVYVYNKPKVIEGYSSLYMCFSS